jgi:hypothetical protein
VGLIAREVERHGIPTAALSVLPEATAKTPAPRNVVVRFRLGQLLGEPGAVVQQRRVLWDALGAFALIATPGGVIELPYKWKRSTYVDPLASGP